MTHNEQKQTAKPPEVTYETPRLKALGSVVDITHGPAGGTIDSIFGGGNGGFDLPSPS